MIRQTVLLVSILVTVLYVDLSAQSTLSARDIISRSIQYHDPQGMLNKQGLTFVLKEERPNGTDRSTEVYINTRKEHIVINSQREGHVIASEWKSGTISSTMDGSTDISKEDIEKYRLTDERLTFMKDYYRYLWHLPTALQDPGTIISDDVNRLDFFGQELWEVKVTYEAEVGKDIWYFYFDPSSYALSGYRFYHDEAVNDGEYILLSGETSLGSLRLPQRREWYTHKEAKYLGADELTAIKK